MTACSLTRTILIIIVVATGISLSAQNLKSYEQSVPGTTVKFKMIAIPAGSFLLGSERGEPDERPQKKVRISAFWMGEHEVTFGEWDAFFKNADIPQTKNITIDAISRPTAQYIDLTWGMGRDENNPTNSMSQQAALMYCKWLYEKTGVFYRLPTEAEWEYACEAGRESPTDPRSLATYGFFSLNSDGKYQKVMQLKPNAWGLFDMLGNLSEWTLDQYDPEALAKLNDNVSDPRVPPSTRYPKVVKGGSFVDDAKELRCSNRIPSEAAWNKRDPQVPKSKWWLTDGMGVGFRIARPAVQPSKQEVEAFFAQYLK